MSEEFKEETPRRILHIGKYFPPHRGGMETMLRDQMNMQVRDEGLKVAAVVHTSEQRFTDSVEITELSYRVRRSARWFTAVFAPISPFFWWSVVKEIRELDPDEIKIHMPNLSAFWLLLLPSARNRRWIILWHSDVLSSTYSCALKAFHSLYRPLEGLMLKKAQMIITTSEPYLASSKPLQKHLSKCSVEPIKLDTLRIPPEAFRAAQPPKEIKGEIRILCVGRLTYYKDFGTVILAAAKMPNTQVRIVGKGEMVSIWTQLANDEGVSHRVHFLGEIPDEELWSQYVWCDLLCLPSVERTEAFGVVICEAAVFNKPVVVANTVGSGMVWAANHLCRKSATFKPQDSDDLVRAIYSIGVL